MTLAEIRTRYRYLSDVPDSVMQAYRDAEYAKSDPSVIWGDYRDPEGEAANRDVCVYCGNVGHYYTSAGNYEPCIPCQSDTF